MIKDFGTIKERVGSDGQMKFGQCQMYLHSLKEPMCCEEGHVFCRECGFDNILKQRKENEVAQKRYDAYQERKKFQEEKLAKEEEEKKKRNFEQLETEFDPTLRKKFIVDAKQKEIDRAQQEIDILKNAPAKFKAQSNTEIIKTSFWVASSLEDEVEEIPQKPDGKLKCPVTHSHPIKPVKLHKLDIKEIPNEGPICHACRKKLNYQVKIFKKKAIIFLVFECLSISREKFYLK